MLLFEKHYHTAEASCQTPLHQLMIVQFVFPQAPSFWLNVKCHNQLGCNPESHLLARTCDQNQEIEIREATRTLKRFSFAISRRGEQTDEAFLTWLSKTRKGERDSDCVKLLIRKWMWHYTWQRRDENEALFCQRKRWCKSHPEDIGRNQHCTAAISASCLQFYRASVKYIWMVLWEQFAQKGNMKQQT